MLDKITLNSVRSCLNQLAEPESKLPLGESDKLRINVRDETITIILEISAPPEPVHEELRKQAIELVQQRFPKFTVNALFTAKNTAAEKPGEKASGVAKVKHIIAVASGKGGVGKSTTTVCLAHAFRKFGLRVGVLDADIYGPSQTRMLNLEGKPDVNSQKQLIPLQADGIAAMSMGLLIGEKTPMIWRGPMVQSALQQLIHDVDWGALDVLLLDMPPGTGDAQLTIAQKAQLTGAVIVTTPQDISYMDAIKGANMFKKVAVPILGVVENMSHMLCENCGHINHVFNRGSLREDLLAQQMEIIGEVPLTPSLCRDVDTGKSNSIEDSLQDVYAQIADNVINKLEYSRKPAPSIV